MDQEVAENYYLNKAILLIEQKIKWGESKNWTNQKFIDLSEKISTASGISISVTTLKRLFGKAKTYKNYQKATKNALAVYVGFKNWEEFKDFHENNIPENSITQTNAIASRKINNKNKAKYTIAFIAAITIIVLFIVILYNYSPKSETATFNCLNPNGTAPFTANFNYDISDIKDSVFIQYDHYGPSDIGHLPANKTFINHFYQIPDYYVVKIYTKKKQLGTAAVNVETNGWARLLQYGNYYFLPPSDTSQKGALTFAESDIKPHGIGIRDKFWIEYRNTMKYNIKGDDFTLETRIKNDYDLKENSCMDSEIELAGETSKSWIVFLQPGCSRFAKAGFGGNYLSGEGGDLSAFTSFDLSKWRNVKIEAKNKKAKIYMDNKLLFEINYSERFGGLRSILFRFLGGGSVDYLRLYNGKKELVYNEDF